MGIGDKLLDTNYKPNGGLYTNTKFFNRLLKCPVTFTEDPMEYIEKYIGYSLRPIQKNIVIDLFSVDDKGYSVYDVAVLICGMRSGKCQKKGTKILMYDGTLKNVEDIKVNDLVMGPDSKPRKVLDTTKGRGQLYTVKQDKGIDYTVNSHHILSLQYYSSYRKKRILVNIPIENFIKKSNVMKKIYSGWKPTIPFIFKDVYKLPEGVDPYLLGLWIADGRKDKFCFSVNNNDSEIINYIKMYAHQNNYTLNFHNIQKNSKDFYLKKNIRHKCETMKYLKNMNLFNNKHIPFEWKLLSIEDRLQLIAGCLDGDGSVTGSTHRKCFVISSSKEEIIYGLKDILLSLGFSANYKKRSQLDKRTNKIYTAYCMHIGGDLPKIPVKLKRKQILKGRKQNFNLSSIKVINAGVGDYYGFTIDGDNLYCLSDYTVTHNSSLSGAIGSFLLHKLIAMEDPGEQLHQLPGQKLSGEYIATSEQQSKQTAYSTFVSIVKTTSWWNKYIGYLLDRETTEGKETLFIDHQRRIAFPEKNLEVVSLHSNSASLAGLTAFYVAFDELSRFDVSEGSIQQTTEKRTAQAVYFTASRATASLTPFSKTIVTTSPMYEADFGMQLLCISKVIKAEENKNFIEALRSKVAERDRVDRMIGYHYTTFEVNPKYNEKGEEYKGGMSEEDPYFKGVKQLSPDTFNRDYKAIPPSAISPFFKYIERIEKAVNKKDKLPLVLFENQYFEETITAHNGVEIRRYVGKKVYPQRVDKTTKYFICCDQGEVEDSFVIAMGHGEEVEMELDRPTEGSKTMKKYKAIVDFVEEWLPIKEERITVSFQNVEEVIRIISQNFYIAQVTFDKWNSAESIQRLFSEGIYTKQLGARFDMYETFKMLLYSGMVEFPDDDELVTELKQLNNIKNKKIDHPDGGGKDKADAVCRVVFSVYEDCIKDAIHGDFILPQRGSLSTLRSMASVFELEKYEQYNGYNVFDKAPGAGNEIFGRDFIVRGNVVPNVK